MRCCTYDLNPGMIKSKEMMRNIFVLLSVLLVLFGCSAPKATPAPIDGEPHGKSVSAYIYLPYSDSETVREKLRAEGFDIVADYAPTTQSETIVISSPELLKMADKPLRGFAAVLRVLVDNAHHRVAYTNPIYFLKAFLQQDFDYAAALEVSKKLEQALGKGVPSADQYAYDDLPNFHFMVGMPRYQDVYRLAQGDSAVLVKKLEEYHDGNASVFKLAIGKERTLVGWALSARTRQFVKKLGTQNAEMLPYTILVEDGNATALAAKYYIAISYPELTMRQFMGIAIAPDSIEKELRAPFE